MVLQLLAPGMEDAGKAGQISTDKAFLPGQPFDGRCRGIEHGGVGQALMRADEGTQGLRDSEGDEEVWSGELFFQLVVQPLRGCMLLTRGTVAGAACVMDAVLPATALALREAVAVVSGAAVLDGTSGLGV